MDEGWIKLARTFETDGHLDRMTDQALRLYVHFRLAAQWCPGRGLQVGQLRISYRKLRTKTGYSLDTIRKALAYLRSAGFITTEQYDAGGPLVVTVCEPDIEQPASLSETPVSPSDTPVPVGDTPVPLSETGVYRSAKQGVSLSETHTDPEALSQKAPGDSQEGNKNGIHKKDTLVPQSDRPPEEQRPKRQASKKVTKEPTEAQKLLASDANHIAKVYDELAKQARLDSIIDWHEANGIVQKQLQRAGAPRISKDEAEQALRWAFRDRRAHFVNKGLRGIREFWSWSLDVKNRTPAGAKGYQPHYTAKIESPMPSGFVKKEAPAT